MLAHDQLDRLICTVSTWDRETLLAQFQVYPSRFPVDLTPEFLTSLTLDRLRHLFFALCLQNQRLPDADLTLACAA